MQSDLIHSALTKLTMHRPVFHSEADFQHALAWELQLRNPHAHIRLEKQIAAGGSPVHLDLLFVSDTEEIAIELKYKTRKADLVHADEKFHLCNQSAQDTGRHDFIKDISRLEKYVHDHPHATGYAVILTNDPLYWTQSRKLDAVDSAFRVHEGRELQGEVTWGLKASPGTKSMREEPISLRGTYRLNWQDYSSFGSGPAQTFRYSLIHIPCDARNRTLKAPSDKSSAPFNTNTAACSDFSTDLSSHDHFRPQSAPSSSHDAHNDDTPCGDGHNPRHG